MPTICARSINLSLGLRRKRRSLQELWNRFSDIAINNDDEIENDFIQFEAGISGFEVWHWFDKRCTNNLHDDLLYKEDENGDID